MHLPFFIARRYFFSKKKKSFINVISIISMLVVAIGTMALIIVLSVFNGFEGLYRDLFGTVDPNLVIQPTEGKSFKYSEELNEKLLSIEGIEGITEVLEDNALIKYNGAQRVARIKGVSENFLDYSQLENYLVFGDLKLKEEQIPYAIVGRGVQYDLAINPSNDIYTLQVYFPNAVGPGQTNPEKMYRLKNILPAGVFAIEKSYDENFVFVPLAFAEDLFGKIGMRSSVEIKVSTSADRNSVKQQLIQLLGSDYQVQSNEEIHSDLYRILAVEKFFVFLTFSIIIAIASINIFFSLNMLVLDKKMDIAILSALGASGGLIRNIFIIEGCIVAFTGALSGLFLGLIICFIQMESGLITLGMESAIRNAYPIQIEWMDILYTLLTIVFITIATAIFPAHSASRQNGLGSLQ